MPDFMPADVGRDIVAGGGLATITGYTDPSTVTVEVKQAFPATAFDSGAWSILGTPSTSCTPSAKDPVGATTQLALGTDGWRAEDVGKYVQINGGLCRITGLTSAVIANAVIEVALNAVVTAPALAWTLEGSVWSDKLGWPRCGTIFQQRLWAGGSPSFPHSIWGSVIGQKLDFTLGSLDTDAISYAIDVGENSPILHLVNARGLVALGAAFEHSIRGGQEKAITPTNIQVKDQSNYGCSEVPPQRMGQEILFVQRAGRKLRALAPNQYDDAQYVAPDVAVLAEHVTQSGIVDMAYQPEPDSLLWAARADGQMATLAADRDQDVFAWSRQVTQGAYESVEVVPIQKGFRVFLAVARAIQGTTTRYIETFEAELHTDCAVTGVSEGGATIWGGLSHLEGRTVVAKGDGVYLGEFEVAGGQITLPRAAYSVEIGLAYTTTVKTLTPEFMAGSGSAQGHQLSIHDVKVRLHETTGCKINLQDVAFRQLGLGVLDQPPPLYTGDKEAGNLGWGKGIAQTLVQQTLPYPFHLLAVITRLTANDG